MFYISVWHTSTPLTSNYFTKTLEPSITDIKTLDASVSIITHL